MTLSSPDVLGCIYRCVLASGRTPLPRYTSFSVPQNLSGQLCGAGIRTHVRGSVTSKRKYGGSCLFSGYFFFVCLCVCWGRVPCSRLALNVPCSWRWPWTLVPLTHTVAAAAALWFVWYRALIGPGWPGDGSPASASHPQLPSCSFIL